MKKSRVIQIIREEIENVMNEFSLEEENLNEFANFFSLTPDIQNKINPDDFKFKGQKNVASTLKSMEAGKITKAAIEKSFKGKDWVKKKGETVFGKKDIQPVVDEYGITLLGKTADVTPKKPSSKKPSSKKPASKKPSSKKPSSKKSKTSKEDEPTGRISKIDGKKTYGDVSDKELKDLTKSGGRIDYGNSKERDPIEDESLEATRDSEGKKMIKKALKDLQKKGILDKNNTILDKEEHKKVWPGIMKDIKNKIKDIE